MNQTPRIIGSRFGVSVLRTPVEIRTIRIRSIRIGTEPLSIDDVVEWWMVTEVLVPTTYNYWDCERAISNMIRRHSLDEVMAHAYRYMPYVKMPIEFY